MDTPLDTNNRWENCLTIFRDNLSTEQFDTWFKPIRFMGFEDGCVKWFVPSQFYMEMLEGTYMNLIAKVLRKEFGEKVSLRYFTPKRNNDPASEPMTFASANESTAVMPRTQAPSHPLMPRSKEASAHLEPQLNPRYNFANYCGSESNQVAVSIGEAIARDPGCTTFNPLFVFGAPGVGKTHLMQAIGIRRKEMFPESRVLYITARLFQSQYTSAENTGKTNDFLNFYQSIDMLIIDDIQDLMGKPKTQNAFFHIFNHLHQNGKQLIMSSDTCPSKLEGMEARLLSRFKWGMTAELGAPDRELRRRALALKTSQDGIELPDDVAEFIVNNVTNSIREIEGIVVSLLAHSTAMNRPIDLDLARMVTANAVKISKRQINFEMIAEKVSEFYNLDPDKIFSKSRKREISDARQMVMYLAKKHANMPTTTIGARLSRNHSTVIYAINTLEQRIPLEKKLQEEVSRIESALMSN